MATSEHDAEVLALKGQLSALRQELKQLGMSSRAEQTQLKHTMGVLKEGLERVGSALCVSLAELLLSVIFRRRKERYGDHNVAG